MSTLGERVKAERESRGWSQVELAQRVTRAGYKMTQGGIAQIERRGETEPKSIVQLAQALGVSVTWLQTNRGDKQRKAEVVEDPTQLGLLGPVRRRGAAAAEAAAAGRPEPPVTGSRPPLQVFSSAQGGTEGARLLSSEPDRCGRRKLGLHPLQPLARVVQAAEQTHRPVTLGRRGKEIGKPFAFGVDDEGDGASRGSPRLAAQHHRHALDLLAAHVDGRA